MRSFFKKKRDTCGYCSAALPGSASGLVDAWIDIHDPGRSQ